jgi:tetratricopeptide (TPR) repeat protein
MSVTIILIYAEILAINQNIEKYKYYLQQIPKYGNEITDEDKSAQKESKNIALPNLYLLKSRLLFDGGYYNEAYTSLIRANKEDFKTTKEQLEFIYRLGRIQHKKENYNKAIYYYQMAIKNGDSYAYYFAANAALNLGIIYEELENNQKAKYYFEQCLNMKAHEYQRSIDQKAKAGLKRLDN